MKPLKNMLLALVLVGSVAGCATSGKIGDMFGSLKDPIKDAGSVACGVIKVQKPDVASKIKPTAVGVADACVSGGPAGVQVAVGISNDLISAIWPGVKDKLDGLQVCVNAPESEACKASWLASYPAALCSAVEGCADALAK